MLLALHLGSTGSPRPPLHTHADLELIDDLYAWPYLEIVERHLLFAGKLFFAYGFGNALTFPKCRGATTVLWRSCDPGASMRHFDKHGVTVFYACRHSMPRLLGAASGSGARGEDPAAASRRRGAAFGRRRRFRERYGVDIPTASARPRCCTFSSPRAGDVEYGTTGKPVPGYDVRLVDDDGNVVEAQDEIGELQVRGPTSAVMYWNNRDDRVDLPRRWTRSATNTSRTSRAISFTAAGATTCSTSAHLCLAVRGSRPALQRHPEVLEAAVVGWPDPDALSSRTGVSWC